MDYSSEQNDCRTEPQPARTEPEFRVNHESEEWRRIPGFESYEVGSLGRVRRGSHVKATRPDKDGYPIIDLYGADGRKTRHLHKIVATVFHPDRRSKLHCEVAHLDGDRANARADNIKWVSKVENHSHKRLHGTHQAGENHPRAKLKLAEVRVIKQRAAAGENMSAIGREYGVKPTTVRDIRNGRRWREAIRPEGA